MAIRIADKTPDKERRKKVVAATVTPDGNAIASVGPKLVGIILDEIREEANTNLKRLEAPNMFRMNLNGEGSVPVVTPAVQQQMRSDGTSFPATARTTVIASGPLAINLTKEQAERLLTVGGERCDCCNKSREEVGLNHLLYCGRCKKAYYCSEECQKTQWKSGHKKYCREPGQIKQGDYVRLNGIQSRPEINGQVVEIIGEDSRTEGRWQVRIPGGERSISIAATKMEQLRPLK